MRRQNRRPARRQLANEDAEQLALAPLVMNELAYDPGIRLDDDEDTRRLSRRMTLETSSNLYAQRRSQW